MSSALKDRVGERTSEKRAKLTEAEMRDFGACIRATRGNTQHSIISSTAVPTVLTRFRDSEFELLTRLGIELKHVLHAEQEYRFEAAFGPGDELAYETTFAAVTEKKGRGGLLAFMVFETPFVRVGDAAPIAFSKTTFVYRAPSGSDA